MKLFGQRKLRIRWYELSIFLKILTQFQYCILPYFTIPGLMQRPILNGNCMHTGTHIHTQVTQTWLLPNSLRYHIHLCNQENGSLKFSPKINCEIYYKNFGEKCSMPLFLESLAPHFPCFLQNQKKKNVATTTDYSVFS